MVLAASTEKEISTPALRVYLGIGDLVKARSRRDRTAWVGEAEVYARSGVDWRTVGKHEDSLERLGLVKVIDGEKGWIIDGHGIATGWDSIRGDFEPLPADPALARYLDPADRRWSQKQAASSGWRAAVVLLATHGLVEADLRASDLARTLGHGRNAVGYALGRLAATGLVRKEGRAWRYEPATLARAIEEVGTGGDMGYLDVIGVPSRAARTGRQDRWRKNRERAVKEKRHRQSQHAARALGLPVPPDYVPDPQPEPEPIADW